MSTPASTTTSTTLEKTLELTDEGKIKNITEERQKIREAIKTFVTPLNGQIDELNYKLISLHTCPDCGARQLFKSEDFYCCPVCEWETSA